MARVQEGFVLMSSDESRSLRRSQEAPKPGRQELTV